MNTKWGGTTWSGWEELALNSKITKIRTGQTVCFDNNTSHYTSIPAYGYKDYVVDMESVHGIIVGNITGFLLLCDRNQSLIVQAVSQSGNTLSLRWYNPTNTAQTIGGYVAIVRQIFFN